MNLAMQQQNQRKRDVFLEKTSIIYPEVRIQDMQDASLQPILVTVCFPGTLPRHLIHENMPIQIAVSVCEELRSFTSPVIEAVSWNVCNSEHSLHSGESDLKSCGSPEGDIDTDHFASQELPISFVPLPRAFNYRSSQDWDNLSQQIQGWLITIPADSQQWTWGRDAFWLAFVGANPTFPRGKWPLWDVRVTLEGPFIEEWLVMSAQAQSTPSTTDDLDNILQQIWFEFQSHVALFFPYPLVSDS
ncbi:hypothetical protein PAXRUDRAFT_832893 [Paxillus rubicundulus Ve08.2h10]|uniref:Uncharacterized protein n=1 Tax=Paxillus rubicundulus Ve08.2h10 TaxID=930991 RepID=A0A0D0DQ67_9AGAM|nr:hypothetical protein PAXRUDRAFT_834147 [Paxillus rubicundulus Ve08.2h10]KIK81375.1 hypothetical protein PAXRUDRAFT_832893 [Paxillus rubicundulus Ve08.2h10]